MLGDSIRRRQKVRSKPQRPPRPAVRLRWSRWLLAGVVAILVSFGTGYGLAVQVLFPAPEQSFEDATRVPDLGGRELTDAQAAIEALGLATGPVTWLPHPDEPAGTVVAQDPLPGQWLRPGAEVRLAVSSGRAQTAVPDVVGLPYETAARLATQLGFEVNRVNEVAPGPAGLVVRVAPRPGTERVLPASITLVVSEAPPAPALPDSGLFPDTPVTSPFDASGRVPARGGVGGRTGGADAGS